MQRRTLSCMLLLVATMVGCGDSRPERFPVSGQVLVDGKPLTYGIIMVRPIGARASQGSVDNEGRFSLYAYKPGDGVVPGTHPVTINAGREISDTKTEWLAPKKYMKPETSGLTLTIDEPRDDVLIELSWDGGKPFIETIQ